MKFFSILLVLTIGVSAAQRVVVTELFMRTTCPYCPYAHRAITRLKSEVGDSLTAIIYHTTGPFNNPDGNGRINFYGISGVPTMIFDGYGWVVGGSSSTYNQYRNWFNGRKHAAPEVDITLTGDYSQTTGVGWAKAKIKNVTTGTITGYVRFVIVQQDTPYPWQSEDSLHFIERKMLPNYVGTQMTLDPDETKEVTQNFTVQSSWERDDCYISVFLQKTTGKMITQAIEKKLVNLGVEEETNNRAALFTIGPNPARKYLMVNLTCKSARIEIIDCTGAVRKTAVATNHNLKIPINDLRSGIYFCRVKTEDRIATNKFVKF